MCMDSVHRHKPCPVSLLFSCHVAFSKGPTRLALPGHRIPQPQGANSGARDTSIPCPTPFLQAHHLKHDAQFWAQRRGLAEAARCGKTRTESSSQKVFLRTLDCLVVVQQGCHAHWAQNCLPRRMLSSQCCITSDSDAAVAMGSPRSRQPYQRHSGADNRG